MTLALHGDDSAKDGLPLGAISHACYGRLPFAGLKARRKQALCNLLVRGEVPPEVQDALRDFPRRAVAYYLKDNGRGAVSQAVEKRPYFSVRRVILEGIALWGLSSLAHHRRLREPACLP